MKSMFKKAQGISLNVIIVAAIGLVVLVLLVAIFTGRINIFGKGVSEAETVGTQNVCLLNADRVCRADEPNGYQEIFPTPATAEWIDCELNCYEKLPE